MAGQRSEILASRALDLRAFAVQAHFAQTRSACLLASIFGMDAADKWAIDCNEANATPEDRIRIRDFVADIEQTVQQGLPVLDRTTDRVVDLVAYLTTSRCVYLLRYVAHHNPEFMERLIESIEEQGDETHVEISTVRQRLITLAKNEALSRIFSAQAMQSIMKIMRSYD
jgi:hypothetical protein